MQLEVNPNTVLRSYDFLQNLEVIVNKRGVGFFVADDAKDKIISYKKKQFVEEELPAIFKTLTLLKINWSDVEKMYQEYANNQ